MTAPRDDAGWHAYNGIWYFLADDSKEFSDAPIWARADGYSMPYIYDCNIELWQFMIKCPHQLDIEDRKCIVEQLFGEMRVIRVCFRWAWPGMQPGGERRSTSNSLILRGSAKECQTGAEQIFLHLCACKHSPEVRH